MPLLGQQRPYGTVCLSAGQGSRLAGTPLPPDKTTRYFTGGIKPLFVVNSQGQKIHALARLSIKANRNQDQSLTVTDGYGGASLSGELTRLDNKVATTNVTIER